MVWGHQGRIGEGGSRQHGLIRHPVAVVGDLNTYRESLIVDNDFMKNFTLVGWFCSGQTFWKNRIGNEDYPAVHPDDPYFYGATICESYSKLNGGWPWLQYGVRDGNVYQCHVRDNKIDNTLGNDWFRAYEGETGIWAEFAFFMGNHGYGSEHRHCSISGNNVKNARVRAYGIWAGIFWGPNFGQNALSYRDIAFDNNFFSSATRFLLSVGTM